MYIKKTWHAGVTVEVKKTLSYRYGRQGAARSINTEGMTEAQEQINLRNAVDELRRILNENFMPGDMHAIFTYPQRQAPSVDEAARDRARLIRLLQAEYRRQESELKRVAVTEYTHKRIHHHLVINKPPQGWGCVKRIWKELIAENYYTAEERERGEPLHLRFPWSPLDDSRQWGKLAEYLIKETSKSHRDPDKKKRRRFSCSRNIKRPAPVVEIITAEKWRDDPAERKGYYIDKYVSFNGVSELTGQPMQTTVYVKIRRRC